jgi:Cu-Zn family superoxide dismutase
MKLSHSIGILSLSLILSLSIDANAAEIKIPMTLVTGGQSIGYVEAQDTPKGVLITPYLFDLPPGSHGMHVHQYPTCGRDALDAGGHWDPNSTDSHKGPYKKGHLGDLPVLKVNEQGKAVTPVLAPHLTVKDLYGHSLMIHAGGDDYSDDPPMGGGGDRIACGVIS